MSKLSKRAISILVIAVFMMSIFAVIPVKAVVITITDPTPLDQYEFGETVIVKGFGVTSGALVALYWDYAIPSGQMNSTLGDPSGSFEVWLKVPEATAGDHYLWVKDVGSNQVDSVEIEVIPLVKLSPSSGLKGDDVDVKGYGFGEEVVVGIQIDPWTVPTETIGTGDGSTKTFAGTLDYFPVVPGTLVITEFAESFTEPVIPDGTLVGSLGGTGTINSATGAYSVTFLGVPAVGLITAVYDRAAVIIEASTSFETDEFGSFTKEFDIPDFPYGVLAYTIRAQDPINMDTVDFTIGASISVTPEEGPTGTVVTVDGRGWTTDETMTFLLGGDPAEVVNDATITVSGGMFSADIVIPSVSSEGTYVLTAIESGTSPLPPATFDFEVTGIPEIVVSPTYGSPGATIFVTGSNFTQIAGTDVVIELWTKTGTIEHKADLVTVETDADGTFEDTFISPAVAFVGYDVRAEDTVYHMYADDAFKVGLIALIINPVYGEAGTKLSITGIGFLALSSYNVTFGTILYEEYGTGVSSGEAISDIFYVPNVPTGIYDILISDEDENEMTVEFRVTAVTGVTLDPAMAPNTYNVTIEGYNFADHVDTVEFVLYNATEEWGMNVMQTETPGTPVKTDIDGNFTAWWSVLDEDTLSLGDYTINVTGYDDFFLQVPFSVVEARVDVAPRKALFDRGDSIQFNVKNDFKFTESYMKIWDPYDNLYWQTETFVDWVKSGDLYTVPYYLQTSGLNPMELSQDAPLGTWSYVFYEKVSTELVTGTFEVGPSAESLLTEKIETLSEELGIDIDTLRVYIDDLGIDMDAAVSSMAEEIATAVAAAEATAIAVADIGETSQDALDAANNAVSAADAAKAAADAGLAAANDAKTTAQQAADAADKAADAAEATQKQQGGLTGLVYGAILASLIAALAAIVSLMQISRRIAG